MKKKILTIAMLLGSVAAGAQVVINVDAQQKGVQVSNTLYGIFFEDINRAADGGLYAELVRNRSFEEDADNAIAWKVEGNASCELTDKQLLNSAQTKALTVKFGGGEALLANEGFWGIHAVQGRTYRLSFFARGKMKGALKAELQDAAGKVTYASTDIKGTITKKWTKYEAALTSEGNDPKARLVIKTDGKGEVTFDVVSLFPPTFKNRENGCRPELAQMLANLKPRFMRFPGGCFVEGQESPENAFRWERTIGPIEKRPGHLNRNWNYRTTDGLGFHEYLQFSEDLGAKPLYVVNVGIWHGGFTPVDSLQPWIDECMNALEYANGPVTSKYGKMRAENGHPEPFNIEYLEIGNENNQDVVSQQSDRYYDRFRLFKEAVLKKYPKMHLIGNVVAWGNDFPKWNSEESVELLDEHYYRTPGWFAENYHKYDSYDRKGSKIYVGEYAVTNGFGDNGNLNAALGEAVFMMGMENNSDIVTMASYAPIFVNENSIQWRPDMIRFNSAQTMGTPSYYVQRLMAENVGTQMVKSTMTNPYEGKPVIEVKPENCKVGVGTWATMVSYDKISVTSKDNASKKVESDCDRLEDFTLQGDGWKIEDGTISQTTHGEGLMAILDKNVASGQYVYNVRARKNGGNEGFLIVFNYTDENNYSWLNIGGWGNNSFGLEQIVDGAKAQVTGKQGSIEQGRWYDIRVEVDGDSVSCFLDNQLIIAARLLNSTTEGIFQNAAIDGETGEMVVKVVNTGRVGTTAVVDVNNFNVGSARVIRLSSERGTDENTLKNPTNIYPVDVDCQTNGNRVTLDVPAYSLNILRIKK